MIGHWTHLPVSFSVISSFSFAGNPRDFQPQHFDHDRHTRAQNPSRPISTIATSDFTVATEGPSSGMNAPTFFPHSCSQNVVSLPY
jgi:hypothetical protein